MSQRRSYSTRASAQSRAVLLTILASVGLVVALGGFTLWHAGTSDSSPGMTAAQVLAKAGPASKRVAPVSVRGIRGIPVSAPQHVALTSAANVAAGTGIASYTAQEALAWAIANPSTINTPTSKVTPADVRVVFMTAAQAGKVLNDLHVALPDNDIVCVVQIHGTFSFHGVNVHNPAGTMQKPQANYSYQVFDGATGNLLMAYGSLAPYIK